MTGIRWLYTAMYSYRNETQAVDSVLEFTVHICVTAYAIVITLKVKPNKHCAIRTVTIELSNLLSRL